MNKRSSQIVVLLLSMLPIHLHAEGGGIDSWMGTYTNRYHYANPRFDGNNNGWNVSYDGTNEKKSSEQYIWELQIEISTKGIYLSEKNVEIRATSLTSLNDRRFGSQSDKSIISLYDTKAGKYSVEFNSQTYFRGPSSGPPNLYANSSNGVCRLITDQVIMIGPDNSVLRLPISISNIRSTQPLVGLNDFKKVYYLYKYKDVNGLQVIRSIPEKVANSKTRSEIDEFVKRQIKNGTLDQHKNGEIRFAVKK